MLMQILDVCNSLTVLDHHKTALDHLNNLFEILDVQPTYSGMPIPEDAIDYESDKLTVKYRSRESGAMIAWNHFNDEAPAPDFVQYISDRDLWQFKMPEARKFAMYMKTVPIDINAYIEHINIITVGGDYWQKCIDGADTMRSLLDVMGERIKKQCIGVKMGDIVVPTFLCTAKELVSELHEYIYDFPPHVSMSCTVNLEKDAYYFSMRSDQEHGPDVSAMCKVHGGGGHKNAAGFELPGPEARELIKREEQQCESTL
jgi:oligoribonuclease NrnB/cAMP/cGMP phosphodiesterase (DHH superfamily)